MMIMIMFLYTFLLVLLVSAKKTTGGQVPLGVNRANFRVKNTKLPLSGPKLSELGLTEKRKFSKLMMMKNCVIMGAPGGGKGTISKRLVQDYGFVHISTGDLLRKHLLLGEKSSSSPSPVGEIMRRGGLVPDETVLQILRLELDRVAVAAQRRGQQQAVLLDGYPRTVAQARELDRYLQIHAVVSLNIPHEVILERMSNRWIHAPSGRTYSYDYNPPKVTGMDDVTGEPLTQRDDDRPDVVRQRLLDYQAMTAPLLKYYRDASSSAAAAAARDGHHQSPQLQVVEFRNPHTNMIYPLISDFLNPRRR